MLKKKIVQTDEFEFFRCRAAQLLDEGLEKQALRLLDVIDQEQLRLLVALREEEKKAAP